MRRIRDANGMLAILDAFAFLIIIASACAALPILEPEAETSTGPFQVMARNVHQAMLGANSTSLPGGEAALSLWRYAEMAEMAMDVEKKTAMVALVVQLLNFLAGGYAWEWTCGSDLIISWGSMSGDIYCDRVQTTSGTRFGLRLAPSGVPPLSSC
jgi:hypothetical protein